MLNAVGLSGPLVLLTEPPVEYGVLLIFLTCLVISFSLEQAGTVTWSIPHRLSQVYRNFTAHDAPALTSCDKLQELVRRCCRCAAGNTEVTRKHFPPTSIAR